MIIVNDLKPGTTFENEGNIFVVLDIQHNKTAMRQMIVKVKVKNLRTGVINEISFTGGDKVEQAHIDKREMQYLYDTDDALVFMDNETYDQIEIQKDHLEWEMKFMKPNDNIMISMYEVFCRIRSSCRSLNANRQSRVIRQRPLQKWRSWKPVWKFVFRCLSNRMKWSSSTRPTENIPDALKSKLKIWSNADQIFFFFFLRPLQIRL